MKKRILSLLIVLVLAVALTVPAFAADLPRLVDDAGLLSREDAAAISSELDRVSEDIQLDIVVITLNSLQGYTAEEAARSLYSQYHYGLGENNDGVLLLVAMADRDWNILSMGYGDVAVDANGRDKIADLIVPRLSAGEYANAFRLFAGSVESMVRAADSSNGDMQGFKAPFGFVKRFAISLVISLIAGLVVVTSHKSQLKSVRTQRAAANYVTEGSLQVTRAADRFLYHQVTRTPRPKEKPSSGGGGRSSGAGRSGSTSGKF